QAHARPRRGRPARRHRHYHRTGPVPRPGSISDVCPSGRTTRDGSKVIPMRNHVLAVCLLPSVCLASALAAPPALELHADVIGKNIVAPSLTVERIQKFAPARDRAAWLAYLKRSQEQMKVDRATLAAELKPGEAAPPQPAEGRGGFGGFGSGMSLRHDDAYFATAPAKHI